MQLPEDPPGTAGGSTPGRGDDWSNNGLVFATSTGGPLEPANLTRRFSRLLSRAGLRRIRFHDLRHSTATLLLKQGVDLVVIKELLGHAHIGVSAGVYAHVRLRLQHHAIDTLGNALSPTDDDPDDPPATAVIAAVKNSWGPPGFRSGGALHKPKETKQALPK